MPIETLICSFYLILIRYLFVSCGPAVHLIMILYSEMSFEKSPFMYFNSIFCIERKRSRPISAMNVLYDELCHNESQNYRILKS